MEGHATGSQDKELVPAAHGQEAAVDPPPEHLPKVADCRLETQVLDVTSLDVFLGEAGFQAAAEAEPAVRVPLVGVEKNHHAAGRECRLRIERGWTLVGARGPPNNLGHQKRNVW